MTHTLCNQPQKGRKTMKVLLQDLTKVFPSRKKGGADTVAVNKFTFEIPDGKLIGLLGPSGCGKSTTLYMISGLQKPSGGQIFFGDEDVTEVSPEDRGIGLVFQECNLINPLTVSENMFLNKLQQGKKGFIKWKELNKITQDFLDKFKFRFKATEKIEDLSASQKQMVEIAKVLYN